jgi:adenylate cyclase
MVGKLTVSMTDLGLQALKNIGGTASSIRAFTQSRRYFARCVHIGETLPLPNKPSIAVLPFDDLSANRDQEYFADGVAEEIITALSRMRWLFVIARNSSFAYKGRAVDVKTA